MVGKARSIVAAFQNIVAATEKTFSGIRKIVCLVENIGFTPENMVSASRNIVFILPTIVCTTKKIVGDLQPATCDFETCDLRPATFHPQKLHRGNGWQANYHGGISEA